MLILKKLFTSRKFLAALATVILLAAKEGLGMELSPDFVNGLVMVVGMYLIGQGIADHGAKGGSQSDATATVLTIKPWQNPSGTATD